MILSAIVPIFLIILAGVVVERLSLLPESAGQILSVFSVNICIPCLLFHIMSGTNLEHLYHGNWWLGILGSQLLLLAAFYLFERRLRHAPGGPAMVSSLSCCFCNAGFVGLSVIINMFSDNPEAMTAAGLSVIAANVVAIIGQMSLIASSRQDRVRRNLHVRIPVHLRLWRFVRRFLLGNPVLMATCLGLAVSLSGITLWQPLEKACSMLGLVSPTCMLFALGFCLRANIRQARQAHSINIAHQCWICFWRLAGVPLLTLATLLLLGCDPLWIAVTTIIMSTGTAIMVATLAQVYQAVPAQAALTVAATNVLSLFSLMGCLWLLTELKLII